MTNIKAIIFNFDNTLIDTDYYICQSLRRTFGYLIGRKMLKTTIKKAVSKALSYYPQEDYLKSTIKAFGGDDELVKQAGLRFHANLRVEDIRLIEGVRETLEYLRRNNIKLFLIAEGFSHCQKRKMDQLNIRCYFENVFYVTKYTKQSNIKRICAGVVKEHTTQILIVGDNVDSEIKFGNILGLTTIQFCFGRLSRYIQPKCTDNYPHLKILKFEELKELVEYTK